MDAKSKLPLFCAGLVGFVVMSLLAAVTPVGAQISTRAGSAPQVTFTKDVAPILQSKCQSCHRTGAMAPMSLLTYQEARPWARDIKQRVLTHTMPPWFVDKTIGIQHFENDVSLSDEQIATIVKWVDEGAPQGDPKDMPAPRVFAEDTGWQVAKYLGRQPDLVLEGTDYTVKTRDQDQWFRPTTDVNLSEPRWVMAVEMRPSTMEGRKVFHHVIATLDQDETNAPSAQVKVSFTPDDSDAGPSCRGCNDGGSIMGGPLMEYAVGKNFEMYHDGTAKLIMPGSKIHWEYHTHAIDHDVTAHPELAVYFYPKGVTPKYRTYSTEFNAMDRGRDRPKLDIRPNTARNSEGFTVLRAAARLESFQPHMHMRGKAMSMEAILPNGKTVLLSYVDHFNFNWMINYIYADDAVPVSPKGTIMHVVAWWDNTGANPNNPDPNQWIGYGERSVDEMGHAWVDVTYISDDDYKAWAATHGDAVRERIATGDAGAAEGLQAK